MKRINRQNINTSEYWNDIYSSREDRDEDNDAHKIAGIVNSIENGKSVIDLGCGTGHFLREIHKQKPNCKLTGVDYSESIINRLKQTDPEIEWIVADVTDTKIDKKYDYVLCFETIEHLEVPEKLVEEIYRLCKWRAILTTPFEGKVPSEEHLWSFDGYDLQRLFRYKFRAIWTMPVGSGMSVCDQNDKEVEVPGRWDLLYVKAEV